jgi:hypothetical protein
MAKNYSPITGDECVLMLKRLGHSTTAKGLARCLSSTWLVTDSRAVATALRQPVKDGRVTRRYKRPAPGEQVCAFYRFVRLKPKGGN